MLFILSSFASAKTLIINSKDWHDVYTGFEYGTFKNYSKILFFSGPLSTDLITALTPKNKSVTVIESANEPYFKGYANYLRTQGFSKVDEIVSQDPYKLNQQLALQAGAKKFIVVSDVFGYDAISVAPYSHLTHAWVLFVNKRIAPSVYAVLKTQNAQSVIAYGHIGRESYLTIKSFNPLVINNGDRFDDNLEIARMYEEIHPTKSIIVTTGEFIEQDVMTGASDQGPVLFTGRNKLYPGFMDFINKYHVKFVTVIGNELIPIGTQIRQKTNKKVAVFVKFGQGFTGGVRRTGQVYALTVFPLPHYVINLDIKSADYEPVSKVLLVTYLNRGNMPAYFMSNIHVKSNGNEVLVLNDKSPVFIEPNGTVTVAYKADLTGYTTTNLTADFYTLYGESPKVMDRYILPPGSVAPPYTVIVGFSNIKDDSEVELVSVVYNKMLKRFLIKVKNTGNVTAYVDAQLKGVVVDGINKDLFFGKKMRIMPGETKVIMISADLSPADILDNEQVNVVIPYGQNKDVIIKSINQQVELKVVSGNFLTGAFSTEVAGVNLGWSIVVVVLLVLIGFFVWKKKSKVKRKSN